MPEPRSARSVSRVSNWAVNPTWSSTSSGSPRSARISRRTFFSAGRFIISDTTPLGSASVRRLSTRIARCGACAALANVFSTSPERCDFGAMRWNAWPSRSGSWAMWSVARATKSTGTMFVQPSSGPTSGNHCGSTLRVFWMSLKK